MPRIIILGTGTNVGKSYVTVALAKALAALSPEAVIGPLKPIETGFAGAASDAATLAQSFRHSLPPQAHPLYGYEEPLTPFLAAQRAGGPAVELEEVRRWVLAWERGGAHSAAPPADPVAEAQAAPRAAHGGTVPRRVWSLIESAGGAFSPIAMASAAGGAGATPPAGATSDPPIDTPKAAASAGEGRPRGLGKAVTNVDLWRALEPCTAVLVARDGLGTLHDIAATLDAMVRHHRAPDYLVLSAAGPTDASRGTNAGVLRTLGIADPIAVLGEDSVDIVPLATALVTALVDRA